MPKIFPAKILLFGEYTVLQDSAALAIPTSLFSGHWVEKGGPLENRKVLNQILGFLKTENLDFLDLNAFDEDIKNGLNFISDIPIGYGMGSSGAVVAAIYHRYTKIKCSDPNELKTRLQSMEDFFHGKSSGMDPLVSYLDKAILKKNNEFIALQDIPKLEGIRMFLIDTKKARSTASLVNIYTELISNKPFHNQIKLHLMEYLEVCIHSCLNNEVNNFFENLHLLSEFQFDHLGPMILEESKTVWRQGLAGDDFKLKLCGAGGGGFVLGFTKNLPRTKTQLKDLDLLFLD